MASSVRDRTKRLQIVLSADDIFGVQHLRQILTSCSPFDPQGRRRDFADIPKTVLQLKDDPFRSLAGELRRAGGFAKDTTPFSEFLWADFFRRKIKRKTVEADFAAAIERALRLARSEEAEYLPGWCGPKADA
jgi:hypothetical protein